MIDSIYGIEAKEVLKIKKALDTYDISIDELIECFDFEKYKAQRIKKLESVVNSATKEIETLKAKK